MTSEYRTAFLNLVLLVVPLWDWFICVVPHTSEMLLLIKKYIHTVWLYIRVYLCYFYLRYLLFLKIFIVYEVLFTYKIKIILLAPGITLKISVYSASVWNLKYLIPKVKCRGFIQNLLCPLIFCHSPVAPLQTCLCPVGKGAVWLTLSNNDLEH